MLKGEYSHNIDAKGRLIIPAKFRDDLGEHFVITKGMENCLYVYPEAEWAAFEEKLNALPTKKKKKARHNKILTGLPDTYGRGRIVGDYRRVALYGIDHLIEEKQKDLDFEDGPMTEDRIRLREEISEQIRALSKMKEMAASYGVDISKPAKNAKEAVQAVCG